MNPFKYIAEIIAQFSKSQRIIALLLLLLSITIIIVVPKLVNTLSHDDSSLTKRIEVQKLLIVELNKDTDSLNDVIRKNQLECTNQIVERETEILGKISHITDMAKKSEKTPRRMMLPPPPPPSDNGDGSPRVAMSLPPEPKVEPKNDQLLNGLMDIKKDIQKSIKQKKGN